MVVSIGTNNTRNGVPEKSLDGIEAICLQIQLKLPPAELLLVSLFPWADHVGRREINESVNRRLPQWAAKLGIRNLDSNRLFAEPDRSLKKGFFARITCTRQTRDTRCGQRHWSPKFCGSSTTVPGDAYQPLFRYQFGRYERREFLIKRSFCLRKNRDVELNSERERRRKNHK
ncbi:SGNH/GDSL hydrolase family protein [Synoicihabitans lomoniglobus]|uniref:SGNH/GDSL hydrolase family protein n=1 Tax=Synoicihabitans lomoniglobus TaxID=2909285 RepID=UPI003CE59D6E